MYSSEKYMKVYDPKKDKNFKCDMVFVGLFWQLSIRVQTKQFDVF